MKVLRLTWLVLLTASLSVILTGQACANDHPWDDASADSNEVVEQQDDHKTDSGDICDHPIIVKARNWFLEFIRSLFSWNILPGEEEDEEESEVHRVVIKNQGVVPSRIVYRIR